jgi:DNA-binding response OmpR family regulator
MINDVLDLSKIEAGKLTFHPVVTLLPPLFDEVVQTLDVQARENQLTIHVQIDARLNEVCIDPTRLKQVLFNFLSNAVKFTGNGGRIDIRATAEGAHLWRLEVQDTGCGIPPAQLSKLFVEFQQLDAGLDKKHQGTGLGLALTRRLVEAQMGRVGVHSQPGHGSCFYAVLPRQHGQAHQMDQHASRVLLAWNDPHVLDALAKALVKAGIPHDPTDGAQEMSQLGQSRAYEAITLDLSQQDAPGLHALASIRASHGESSQAAVKAIGYSCQTGVSVAFPVANVLFKPLQRDRAWSSTWRTLQQPTLGAKVLVIDDDPAACEMMQVALREVGLVTISVQQGQNILETLDKVQPMAMVLDLMMPGVSGFQVLDAIRQSPKWSGLPVIVWTAMTLSMEEQWLLSQSAQAIASKGDLDTIATVRDALLQWFLNQPQQLNGSEAT